MEGSFVHGDVCMLNHFDQVPVEEVEVLENPLGHFVVSKDFAQMMLELVPDDILPILWEFPQEFGHSLEGFTLA